MTRIIPGQLGAVAKALGEIDGREVNVVRVKKNRRDYTAKELRDMADRAAAGDAPAGSVADVQIRRSEMGGDFERARALRLEVKAKAPALARLARAAEKAERRARKHQEAKE